MMYVIKRDGRKKIFDAERIVLAVGKAQLEVEGKMNDLGESIANLVIKHLTKNDMENINIETIQDLVVGFLGEENKDVARAYESYREERSIKRNENDELIKSISGLVDFSNEEVLSENSNKQAQLISTQRDLVAGEVSKYIAKTRMIPKHLIEAHNRGEIKIHK